MKKDAPTKKQRRLLHELEELSSLLRLDYRNCTQYPKEERTPRLELIRNQLIRGEVIVQYTLIDEHLNVMLCNYFFGREKSFIRLWKTKKFQTFNYHILEELSLMQKLKFVRSIGKIPKTVTKNIERINALRNGLAHAFFPENLRKSKPVYKGKDIFTLEGISSFIEDMADISDFFVRASFGRR